MSQEKIIWNFTEPDEKAFMFNTDGYLAINLCIFDKAMNDLKLFVFERKKLNWPQSLYKNES